MIGPLAIVKLAAGLLLALAPLMAGLLLFVGTRDLFFGWLRGLGALALGAFSLYVVMGVQLAVLEPWLADALSLREARVFTPSMPTELNVITLVFALVSFGMLAILTKIFFFGGFHMPRMITRLFVDSDAQRASPIAAAPANMDRLAPSRALQVADIVSQTIRREEQSSGRGERSRTFDRALRGEGVPATASGPAPATASSPLGSSFRATESRHYRRTSAAGDRRDSKA
jgi:type IV secretion system protein VirB6